ncbi:sentrin-specific protease-like [Frankliniella occidentalis]|uniref:Sentrin-specific protease-like n=1 Tax=Frankliniella occidentalis TaxID=133901 RepID=A0A9C6XSP2_FRAOC|nr:sentrin-specific protease-like [Frankliniella occidentalis]
MVNEFGLKISKHDLDTLLPSQMLNDQIMNFYVQLLAEPSKNVYIFNTFFMVQLLSEIYQYEDIKGWTKNVDIFYFPLVLIPIYKSTHWTMAVINNDLKQLMFYNSLSRDLYVDCFEVSTTSEALKKYLKEEHQERKGVELDFEQWNVMGDFIDGPMQKNWYECGVFVLEVARRLCLEQSLEFTQEDIPRIRRRIRTQILNCLLMD